MIRPVREDEIADVCTRLCEIDPWKRLRIQADELVHGLQMDPLRRMLVWQVDENASVGGVVILRLRSAAEMLFFRGFGQIMAARYHVGWPCEWSMVPDGGYIGSLAVLDGHTGRGIGQALIDAAHAQFMAAGHRYSFLLVSSFNHSAQRFYERNGYEFIGHVDNCLLPGNREHLMEKVL